MKRTAFAIAVVVVLAACGDNQTHPGHSPYDAGGPAPLQCVPNLDGVIDSKELKPVLGVPVKYLVSPAGKQRPVDLVGAVGSGGTRTWAFGVDLADDQTIQITAQPLQGKWYQDSYPAGQFVTQFDASGTLEAVYAWNDQAIALLGLASKDPSPPEGKTLIVYTPPVLAMKFPVQQGATWSSVGTVVNGMLRGLPYAGQDTYELSDDAVGQLVLPDLTFTQAHRIKSKVTLAPSAGQTVVTRQTSFYFECFGEVARATSLQNETNDDFTTASEVRRFGF